MDEMTMFAELRPTELPMTDADLASLRAELFGDGASSLRRPEAPGRLVELASHRSTRRHDRRRGRVAVAAAVVVAAGLAGVWLVADRDAAEDGRSAQPDDAVEPASPAASPYDLPRFAFSEPGWTMTHASESAFGGGRAVVFLSRQGFDGPWVELSVSSEGAGGELPERSVGSVTMQVSAFDDGFLAYWIEPGGRTLQAYGWRSAVPDTAAVLESATLVDGAVELGSLPMGMVRAEAAAAEALGRSTEYEFAHADGRTLSGRLSGGGARGLYGRIGGERRDTVAIGGESWSVTEFADGDDAQYRADVLRDFWTWEFDGSGFASQAAFVATVAGAQVVDLATWEASLPDNVVGPSAQLEAVAALLADVPVPAGFDAPELDDGSTNDRYQLIAHVSGAVTCAWLDLWFTGAETGDAAMQADAAAALATSREWPMLVEIADQGGWSDQVWLHADAVNGGEGVTTGAGPVPPTRDEANSALGCAI